MASAAQETLALIRLLNNPATTALRARSRTTGSIAVTARDPVSGEATTVSMSPPTLYELTLYASMDAWRGSADLVPATQAGLVGGFVNEQRVLPSTPPTAPTIGGPILSPNDSVRGSMLVFDGQRWSATAAPNAADMVLTSQPSGALPLWVDAGGGGPSLVTLSSGRSTNQPGVIAAGSFPLASVDYESADFVTVGALSDTGLLGDITLHNITDDIEVASHSYNGTTPTTQSSAIALAVGTKLYELRIELLNGLTVNDRLICSWAGLRLVAA